MNHLSEGRRGFRERIDELDLAASLLSNAVDAHLAGRAADAASQISAADLPEIREWLESIWGSSAHTHYREVAAQPPVARGACHPVQRMPSMAEKRAVVLRDGHRCRLCGLPVIRAEVRRRLHAAYPQALPWGRSNRSQHAAFQALWLQYDHVIPHARGGTNAQDNLIVACAACNFGRMNYTLAEVGFAPLATDFDKDRQWDGLERMLDDPWL